MEITRMEKAALTVVLLLTIVGFSLLVVKVVTARQKNLAIEQVVKETGKLTDKSPLFKGLYFDSMENQAKLNLNRTDLKSIRAIPGMTSRLATSIYNFIHKKKFGKLKSIDELLEVRSFNRKHLNKFAPYITVDGGHAGFAAWGDKLNLNFAREEDLSALPGITKAVAKNIVEYRNSKGNFTYLEELMNVKGVTNTSFNKIKGLVAIQ